VKVVAVVAAVAAMTAAVIAAVAVVTSMFDKTIVSIGLAAAVAAALATPAKAEPVAGIFAAGFVGAVIGAGIASTARRDETRWVEGYPVWDYGVPAYQRPRPVMYGTPVAVAGPGRHRVCAWQERYDRHEHYIGSRRICWIEAR
jgi:hypothetical protein